MRKVLEFCVILIVISFGGICKASVAACSDLTFSCLHPEFLKTEIPAYWPYVSPTSPVPYSKVDNDYISQFVSPSGQNVTVIVKSPVTKKEYTLPPLAKEQNVYDYFYYAALDSNGNLRNQTYIKIPKATYNFPSTYNRQPICSFAGGTNWPLPAGLTDVVIDGQGSTINFSGLCSGINLQNATRVVLKNFTIAWGGIKIASLGTITDASQDVPINGGPFKVKVNPINFGPSPIKVASVSRWDSENNHYDLKQWNDASYFGDGVTSGTPYQCAETHEQQKTEGCTLTLWDQGDGFKKGETVVVMFYNYGSAISVSGNDVTLDNITLENILGTGFALWGGRGFRVTHSTLTRMANEPISGDGNASAEFGAVSGDVVFDYDSFGYQGDDSFQLNWNIVQYFPNKVPPPSTYVQTPLMYIEAFNPSAPSQFLWPWNQAAVGDIFVLYDNNLNFKGVRRVTSVSSPNANNISTVTLDHAVDADMIKNGFIGGDLTQFAGARYVVNNNIFQFCRGRVVLQTPFGLVNNNHFVGQTLRSVYVSTSLYWGEGGSAQELTIANNVFDARGHDDDFLALNIDAEPLNPYLNMGPEVIGSKDNIAAPVNENIIVANNTFLTDHETDVVNIASAHNILFSGNDFILWGSSVSGQYPVSIHDASDIYFDNTNDFSAAWLKNATCTNSRLLQLSNPKPVIAGFWPLACGVVATTSNISLGDPDVCTTNFNWKTLPPTCVSGDSKN